jgi:hypothetical protein
VEPVKKVPSVRPQLGNNTAISLLRVRKHGFVAVEGPGGPLLPLTNDSGCRPTGDACDACKIACSYSLSNCSLVENPLVFVLVHLLLQFF